MPGVVTEENMHGAGPRPPWQEMLGRFTATEEQTGSGREDQGRCSAKIWTALGPPESRQRRLAVREV